MARKKRTFGERLIASAHQAAMIHRGEMEPARVTKYTEAGAHALHTSDGLGTRPPQPSG
jgi:hypothetical protein